MRGLGEGFGGALDGGGVLALHHLLEVVDLAFHVAFGLGVHLVGQFLEALGGHVDHGVGIVARLDQFLALLVLLGVHLGVLLHPLDLGLGETGRGGDADRLLLAGAMILGRDVQDAVGVQVEGDLDLRHAARRRRDVGQFEAADGFVVGRHLALALENVDGHRRLVVGRGGERLALLGGHGGVLLNQLGHDPAQGLDAQRQRGDVEQEHVLDLALEHAALDGRADGHHLIRVDALVRILAEDGLDLLLHLGHAGHTANEDNLVDLAGTEPGVLEGGTAGAFAAVDQILDQGFQLGAAQLDVEVLGAAGVGGDERQVDVRLHGRGQLFLGLFRLFLEPLQGHLVVAQVNALVALELVGQPVDDAHVKVLAAEEGVAVGRFDLEHAVADLQDGDVEGTAAQVEHGDLLLAFFVQTVGQRGGRGLVDDALHVQAGDLARVLGGLTLGVVEVGRHGDHRVGDRLAQVLLGGLLHLAKDHGRDLGRRVFLAVHFDHGVAARALDDGKRADIHRLLHFRVGELAADEALDGEQGLGRVGDRLTFGDLPDETLAAVGEGDDGRGGPVAFGVFDDLGVTTFHDGHARVGRAQVDAYNFSHDALLLSLLTMNSVNKPANLFLFCRPDQPPFRKPAPDRSTPPPGRVAVPCL